MLTCVISQPRFFPGLHYLHRMMVADVFVIFDSVQFNPRHEENRAKLKSIRGSEWLTVPMRRVSREQLIQDTRVDNHQPWPHKAWQTIQHLYGKAPHFAAHAPGIHKVIETPWETLTELDRASWEPALRLLGISCRFVCASELPVSGKGPRLLLDICKYVGADTYVSGMFGREYLDPEEFAREGIGVHFHHYEYPVYPQRHDGFIPYLSYLDVLFNTGLERDFVLAGGRTVSCCEEGVGS
ncbi:MAG TPA: WbqC family protein [Gemmataceae bacterium]|nr:WbqC family protein [Gemmataceae bacterium]